MSLPCTRFVDYVKALQRLPDIVTLLRSEKLSPDTNGLRITSFARFNPVIRPLLNRHVMPAYAGIRKHEYPKPR